MTISEFTISVVSVGHILILLTISKVLVKKDAASVIDYNRCSYRKGKRKSFLFYLWKELFVACYHSFFLWFSFLKECWTIEMCKQKWFWTWGTKSNNTIQIEIITNCSPKTIMILDSYYILMRDLVGGIWLELIDLWIYSYFSLICMTTFGINWDINESIPNKGLLSQKWLHLTGHFILQASFWMTFIYSLIIIMLFFFSQIFEVFHFCNCYWPIWTLVVMAQLKLSYTEYFTTSIDQEMAVLHSGSWNVEILLMQCTMQMKKTTLTKL